MWKKKRDIGRLGQPKVVGGISRTLDLPMEILEGLVNLELRGNREAVVEHCEGVLEYQDNQIKIRAGKLTLVFAGRGLRLCCMTDESVVITGYFTSLSFLQQSE